MCPVRDVHITGVKIARIQGELYASLSYEGIGNDDGCGDYFAAHRLRLCR